MNVRMAVHSDLLLEYFSLILELLDHVFISGCFEFLFFHDESRCVFFHIIGVLSDCAVCSRFSLFLFQLA